MRPRLVDRAVRSCLTRHDDALITATDAQCVSEESIGLWGVSVG